MHKRQKITATEFKARERRKNQLRVPHVWVNKEERKSCEKCGGLKKLTEFDLFEGNWDGRLGFCRPCAEKTKKDREKETRKWKNVAQIDPKDGEKARERLLYIEEERVKREKARQEASEKAKKAILAREEALRRLAATMRGVREATIPARCLACFWGGRRDEASKNDPCPKCGSKVILGRSVEAKDPR